MSSIVTQHGILHYESLGRGQPLILLHGWINSWDVWRETMLALSSAGSHRVYALDFWGFGDSAKGTNSGPAPPFRLSGYVEMVKQFMDTLGIREAPVLGHSMGGTVALRFALTYQSHVVKVGVVGSPVHGTLMNPFLKLAGYGPIASMVWRFPFILKSIMAILLSGDSQKVKRMISRDVKRTTVDSFFRTIGDLRDTDLRSALPGLGLPTLGIYGVRDNIVSPKNAQLLSDGVQNSQIAMMPSSRHFPMQDEPASFLEIVSQFVDIGGQDHMPVGPS